MIKHLVIKNYALIQHLEMRPSSTLNTITGETGAGKSIMLGAIGLLLGNRADGKVLYDKDKKCSVEIEIDVAQFDLKPLFEECELDYDNECIIRREISPSGKSRAFVNDTPVTLDVLKKIGVRLVDIHSQHDTLLLGRSSYQLQLIDSFAQNKQELIDYQGKYSAYQKAVRKFESLKAEYDTIKNETEYNSFLYHELAKAELIPGELEQLEEEQKLIEHAEEIKRSLLDSIAHLDESEFSILEQLSNVYKNINSISSFSKSYENYTGRIDSVLIELKDILNELKNAEETIEYDESRANVVNDRLSLLYNLFKKHSVATTNELIEIQNTLSEKLKKALNLDDDLKELEKNVDLALQQTLKSAESLSKTRKSVFKEIKSNTEKLLVDLGMPHATIVLEHTITAPSAQGQDDIKLLFSANKGIAADDLKNVASGGEFSRLMFAIKYQLASKMALPTIIFDEIDTGISGEIALQMARMMQDMAKRHQVITITHLPQIAAKGDTQFFVYKDKTSAKSMSNIRKLNIDERAEEIARMIGGDTPSKAAKESAIELLKS